MGTNVFPSNNIFEGGQMTDLPAYGGAAFDGAELFEVVSPGGALGPSQGVNYSITSLLLASLLAGVRATPTIIQDEAAYASVASDTRILVNNTGALTTTITLLTAASYVAPILVKDMGGFASIANPVKVVFSDGETTDGLTEFDITTPYGFFWFNPLAAGNFYET